MDDAARGVAWLTPARAADAPGDAVGGTVIEKVPTDDGGHELWIMGQYRTLPKEMQWRSTELEAVMAVSQELLAEPDIDAEIGAFAGLGALPSVVGVRNNPDGRRLEELMPIQLYARWLELKAEYLGYDPDVERWRPIFAAFELYRKAVDAAGLTYSPVCCRCATSSVPTVTSPGCGRGGMSSMSLDGGDAGSRPEMACWPVT